MKHSVKEWVAATRYWALPVSTMPLVVSFAYLFSISALPVGAKPWIVLVLSLLGVVLLHSAGNLLSDWFDYRSGVDNENAYAVPNLVFGKFQPKEYLVFSIVLFVLGIIDGLVITMISGIGVLIIGVIAVVLTALYSFLKYHALGDLDIFIIFGVLTVLGLAYAVTGGWCWDTLMLSVPLGVITVSVLHANNTYDIPSDGTAGIKTFAMVIGEKASAVLYCAYMVIPFVWIIGVVVAGYMFPHALLCLLAGVKAFQNFKQAAGYKKLGREAMKGLDFRSSQLQLAFSLLLAAGLFLSAWL
ncbi:MAG: prenyltransferase [Bacteroidales bacterium]|nr:prenyltransferase [Bacteroidales bacterium]